MATYCTVADLIKSCEASFLADLADDRRGVAHDLAYADTAAVLADHIERASNEVYAGLIGRVDFTDAQVLADCKRLTVAIAIASLYARRHMYPPGIQDAARAARAEVMQIRRGEKNTGLSPQPVALVHCTTEDKTPVFGDDADGNTSAFMEGF